MESNRNDNLISNRLETKLRRRRKSSSSLDKSSTSARKNRKISSKSAKSRSREELLYKLKKRHLVFLDESPDYCHRNISAGFAGMIGRSIDSDPSATGKESANGIQTRNTRLKFKNFRKMCVDQCGFKIQRKVLDVWTSCQCRFHWCCKVECETCRRKRTELTCVP